MEFEWDAAKAASNLVKHGVPFELAAQAFDDPLAVEIDSTRERDHEIRRKRVGMVGGRLLTVVFSLRPTARLRLISARRANKAEERAYGISSNDT
jgi:uncharacterized DUF497 family protein